MIKEEEKKKVETLHYFSCSDATNPVQLREYNIIIIIALEVVEK